MMKKFVAVLILQVAGAMAVFASDGDLKVYQKRYVKLGFEDPRKALKTALERPDSEWEKDIAESEKIFKAQHAKKVVTDEKQQKRIEGLISKVLAVSHRPSLDLKLVILDEEFVNAFTYGGRYIYVTKVMLAQCNDEAMTFTFAHELSHIMARHSFRRRDVMTRAWNLKSAELKAGEALFISDLHSRICEAEADALAVHCVRKAGVKIDAFGTLFAFLQKLEADALRNMKATLDQAARDAAKLQEDCDRLTKLFKTSESEESYLQLIDAADRLAKAQAKQVQLTQGMQKISIACLRSHPEGDVRTRSCQAMVKRLESDGLLGADKVSDYVHGVLFPAKAA